MKMHDVSEIMGIDWDSCFRWGIPSLLDAQSTYFLRSAPACAAYSMANSLFEAFW